jgi:hypothetical protein
VKVVIIISGRISKEFYQELKNNINEILAIPKIKIFTRNSKKFIEENEKSKEIPLDHPFFNEGGVVNKFHSVQHYISLIKNYKSNEVIIDINENNERFRNEEIFNFE